MLLDLLDVDCMLTNEKRFQTKLGMKKMDDLNHEYDDISLESQDYLKKFIS